MVGFLIVLTFGAYFVWVCREMSRRDRARAAFLKTREGLIQQIVEKRLKHRPIVNGLAHADYYKVQAERRRKWDEQADAIRAMCQGLDDDELRLVLAGEKKLFTKRRVRAHVRCV